MFYHKNFVESKQQESMSLCKLSEILGIFHFFPDFFVTAMTESGPFGLHVKQVISASG